MITTITMNVAIDKRYVIERFELGTVMRVKECNYTPGGKGLNVSKVASLMGEEVTATGFIGGHAGEYVAEKLGQFGVNSSFVKLETESRSCINFYDEATGKQTEFLEPGAPVAKKDIDAFFGHLSAAVEKSGVVAISGSVPAGVDTGIYADIISAVKKKGKKVILDTSGDLLERGVKACPTMVKPNADEIKALTGVEITDREHLADAAVKLHKSGIPVVAVSLGRDGALIVCDDGIYKGTTPDIPVVNTVGCGDAMVAAFAVGFSRGISIVKTIKTAMAVSTANALRVETGFFLKEDFDRLINLVEVTKYR